MPSADLRSRAQYAMGRRAAGDELIDLLTLGFATTGSIFYVHSGTGNDTNRDGLSSDEPFATIDRANNACTASKGDTIIVMPGHAETLSAAAAIALDVVGVTVQGVGRGTDRPQVTFSATAATITVTAANAVIKNIHFINDVDALVVGIPVTAAHCRIEDCLFDDVTAAKQTVDWITLSAAADYFEAVNCEHHGSDTAGSNSFITGAAADHVKVVGLISHGDFGAANIEMTAAWTDCAILDCQLENANAVDVNIEGFAAATGWVDGCRCLIATDTQVTWINTVGTLMLGQNYGANVGGESGILIGTPSV